MTRGCHDQEETKSFGNVRKRMEMPLFFFWRRKETGKASMGGGNIKFCQSEGTQWYFTGSSKFLSDKTYLCHWMCFGTPHVNCVCCWLQVRNHLFVFINCFIENPTFDSQTKENMTLVPKNFGSKFELQDQTAKKVCFRPGAKSGAAYVNHHVVLILFSSWTPFQNKLL